MVERRDFNERLNELNVFLENIVLWDYGMVGMVKVWNLVFEKRIIVWYIMDGWLIYCDVVG